MTHLDLFSGIGGFALAAKWAGFETIGFSEIDPYAIRVLAKHWPDVPNFGDIRNVRGVGADLVTGGFPCQPFSVAGKRRGKEDDRALWPEMRRVIEEARPAWLLAENVPGIIGMELDNVLSDLESLGYSCGTLLIPACAVDARHRRNRVWIVGGNSDAMRCSRNGGAKREVQDQDPNPNGICKDVADSERGRRREQLRVDEPRQTVLSTERKEGASRVGSGGEALADANGSGLPKSVRRPIEGVSFAASASAGSQSSGGSSTEWTTWLPEPNVGRVANGIPARVDRLKGLGNAIVPQVAFQILKAIADMSNVKPLA